MHFNIARGLPVQAVCVGSALLSAAYYADWAPDLGGWIRWPMMLGLAAFAAGLDLVKPIAWTAVATTAKDGKVGSCFGALLIAILLALASMLAIDGMIMKLRSDAGGTRTNVQSRYDAALADRISADKELAQIGPVEPVAALKASLEASVPVDVWARTSKCTDVTKATSREACQPVFAIRAKIAKAERADELRAQRAKAAHTLATTERPASADPQLESLAGLLNLTDAQGKRDTGKVMLIVTWIVGLAIELVSCFGPALLAGKVEPPAIEPKAPRTGTPEQQALHSLLDDIGSGGGKVSVTNGALAARFSIDPATMTRWRQKWVADGVIEESKSGRQIIMRVPRRAPRLVFAK